MKTIALLVAFLATAAFADEPNITNARLTRVPASGDLVSQITSARGWIGYMLPLAEPRSVHCNSSGNTWWEDEEKTTEIAVLYEVENREIERIRIAARDCHFNALGEPVTWIENASERAAIDMLIHAAKRGRSTKVRQKALFWLGMQAGAKAAQALRNAVDDDPETEVKTRAVFGISQLPNDQSIPILIQLMKTHRLREVRRKAAFWLGQKDDPRAIAAIEEILLR